MAELLTSSWEEWLQSQVRSQGHPHLSPSPGNANSPLVMSLQAGPAAVVRTTLYRVVLHHRGTWNLAPQVGALLWGSLSSPGNPLLLVDTEGSEVLGCCVQPSQMPRKGQLPSADWLGLGRRECGLQGIVWVSGEPTALPEATGVSNLPTQSRTLDFYDSY